MAIDPHAQNIVKARNHKMSYMQTFAFYRLSQDTKHDLYSPVPISVTWHKKMMREASHVKLQESIRSSR